MEKISIHGGHRLKGSVQISGAKNAALPIMAASLLTKEKVVLHNVPELGDVQVMMRLLRDLGAKVRFENNTMMLEADRLSVQGLSKSELTSEIRYSIHLVGALIPQFGKISISLPGGCAIGTRRLDSHILGLRKLGAKTDSENGLFKVTADELKGCDMRLEYPSVGATENIMIAASLAKGTSVIENAAKEPEIIDLAGFLNCMGADIEGAGTHRIKINGVDKLHRAEYRIIPDRVETGTYIVAAAITRGNVSIRNTELGLLESVVSKLRDVGVRIEEANNDVRVTSCDELRSADIVTEVYPGFPTDMQPIITPLLSLAEGESTIKETIFERRFNHISELVKMGADVEAKGDTLFISGVSELRGAEVRAADIRAGGALILAGLAAKGVTTVTDCEQIYRGYEDPIGKLAHLGAKLNRTND